MFDPARLVFIDETVVSTNLVRLRGRAPPRIRLEAAFGRRDIPKALRAASDVAAWCI